MDIEADYPEPIQTVTLHTLGDMLISEVGLEDTHSILVSTLQQAKDADYIITPQSIRDAVKKEEERYMAMKREEEEEETEALKKRGVVIDYE